MNIINRNVSIVVVILVLVVIAGYLVWLRSKYQPLLSEETTVEDQVIVSPTPVATSSATIATESAKQATGSGTKSATSSSTKK